MWGEIENTKMPEEQQMVVSSKNYANRKTGNEKYSTEIYFATVEM